MSVENKLNKAIPLKERWELSEYTKGLIFIAFDFFGALVFIGFLIASIILACFYPAGLAAYILLCVVCVAMIVWLIKDAIQRLKDEYGYF